MNEMKSFPFSLFLSRRPSNAFFGDGRVREREKEKGVAGERRKSFRMLRASTFIHFYIYFFFLGLNLSIEREKN
jgi:hypothetical protein